jgi:hypothetical protein
MKSRTAFFVAVMYAAFPTRSSAQDAGTISIEPMVFATAIVDREPVDVDTRFDSRPDMIYCFTRIDGAPVPSHVFHVWSFNGEEKRRVRLDVSSASWRTWSGRSTEALLAQGEGIWEVYVESPDGQVLRRATFTIMPAGR